MDADSTAKKIRKERYEKTRNAVTGGKKHADVFEAINGRLNTQTTEGEQKFTGSFLTKWHTFRTDQEATSAFVAHFGRGLKLNEHGFTFSKAEARQAA